MSRIGKQPVEIPSGVKAEFAGGTVKVKGPRGELSRNIRPEVEVKIEDGKIYFKRTSDAKAVRAYHGLERSLTQNMVIGVTDGFEKILDVKGVGYRAEVKGKILNLGLGYSHDIQYPVPEGIKASVLKEGREIAVKIEGIDKQLVGQVSAEIRSLRPPEPYKGKGVQYRGEAIRRKAGKQGKK